MLETSEMLKKITTATAIVCDRCHRRIDLEEGHADCLEAQEFIRLKDTGGYNSVIGDMVSWSLDLCQHCFVELCGPYLQYHNKKP